MDLWWAELMNYTKRDQLSLPYVLYKSELKVKFWDWNYKYVNPYFMRYLHRRGVVSDLNVFLKNKQLLRPFNDAICGAALFIAHGGQGPARSIRTDWPRHRRRLSLAGVPHRHGAELAAGVEQLVVAALGDPAGRARA